ncbi:MAG TPA: hypothetical protein VFU63_08055 [Ktedonobacterales bacterium]|nr:hypothetical protein [Ktedonobacterales bacterium]
MQFISSLAAWRKWVATRSAYPIAARLLFCATLLALVGCASTPRASGGAPAATPTPVIEGPLASVVGPAAASLAQRISTSYDTSTQQAKITITIGVAPDVRTAQTRVMMLSFAVQKALWASNPSLREVKVIVLGPVRNDYGEMTEDAYGVSDVFAATAAKLQWDTLTPESAWSRYDNTWLRPAYQSNWIYGKDN